MFFPFIFLFRFLFLWTIHEMFVCCYFFLKDIIVHEKYRLLKKNDAHLYLYRFSDNDINRFPMRDQTKAILKQSSSHEQDRSKPNHVFKLLLKGMYPGPWLSTTDIINISLAEWKCWDKLGSMLQSNLDKSFPIKYIFFKKILLHSQKDSTFIKYFDKSFL